MPKRRHYYHITADDSWGKRITLRPRCPHYKDETEPDVPRICVAPTVADCLTALMDNSGSRIFRTVEPIPYNRMVVPYGVYDSQVTNERWLFETTTFEEVLDIPPNIVDDLPSWDFPDKTYSEYRQKRMPQRYKAQIWGTDPMFYKLCIRAQKEFKKKIVAFVKEKNLHNKFSEIRWF